MYEMKWNGMDVISERGGIDLDYAQFLSFSDG